MSALPNNPYQSYTVGIKGGVERFETFSANEGSFQQTLSVSSHIREMLVVMSEISESIDNLRREIKADTSALDARLTTQIRDVKTDLTGRIDEVKVDLSKRVDDVKTDLSKRIDSVDTDLKGLKKSVDRLPWFILGAVVVPIVIEAIKYFLSHK